jgi:hypothetical protein
VSSSIPPDFLEGDLLARKEVNAGRVCRTFGPVLQKRYLLGAGNYGPPSLAVEHLRDGWQGQLKAVCELVPLAGDGATGCE